MNPPAIARSVANSFGQSRWSTSAFGDVSGSSSAAVSSADVSALGEHLNLCKGLQGRLFLLRCMAERLNGFVAARLVTTLVIATLFIGVGALVV